MKVPLRGLSRVRYKTLIYILKTWKTSFSIPEKTVFVAIALLIALTSWRWSEAAGQMKNWVPKSGGVYIEGLIGNSLEGIDLGRLTKASLVRPDKNKKIVPDLATSWEVSEDKLSYKFKLVERITAYEILDTFTRNPTYLPSTGVEVTENNIVTLKLDEPNPDFLEELTRPIFPYGPYRVAKKTNKEIRLERNPDYHLQGPYINKFTIRLYDNEELLQKAANKGKISGALGLRETPKNWQEKTLKLEKKHVLFINSSKPYLKRTAVREKILNGEKPDGLDTLDVLEINGESQDKEYVEFKDKLTKADVKLSIRKVDLKDAVNKDLPKRNYDLLYILVDQSPMDDPYTFYNSAKRSANGQNFAEVANADIDDLTENYSSSSEAENRKELREQISILVDEEKIVREFNNLERVYRVSKKVKGFELCARCFSDFDRFDLAGNWHFYTKRHK